MHRVANPGFFARLTLGFMRFRHSVWVGMAPEESNLRRWVARGGPLPFCCHTALSVYH